MDWWVKRLHINILRIHKTETYMSEIIPQGTAPTRNPNM